MCCAVFNFSFFVIYLMALSVLFLSLCNNIKLLFLVFKIYTDFDEIRQEIEAETERISGSNKVHVFLSDTNKRIYTPSFITLFSLLCWCS